MNIPGDFEYQVGKLYRISKHEQSSILPSYFVSHTHNYLKQVILEGTEIYIFIIKR